MGRPPVAYRFPARFRRPVVVIQGEALNHSRIATVICIPLTSNLKWSDAPGNVLTSKTTGLAKDSVANVSQILTLDREMLPECAGKISRSRVQLILAGLM